jgi:peptidyl-prolyl cis-trans isomerase D
MIRFLQTPSRGRKILFGVIIFLACVAMVITLIPGGFLGDAVGLGSPGQGVLAQVGDQEVTYAEADQMARNMVRRQFPQGAPPELMGFFRQRAVQSLIVQKAMLVEAERMGLRVSDAELATFLQHGPLGAELFPGGRFIGQDQYQNFVQQAFNFTVPQFEKAVKDDLLMSKLRNVVLAGVTVSDNAVRNEFVRRNTKVKFEYALLTTDSISSQLKPTDAELKAFYDQNKARYANSVPEKRTVQYIFIGAASLKNKVQVTPDDLKNYYNQHVDEFRVPEEVKVRHILVKAPGPGPDGKADTKGVDAARAKAEDLLKKIKAGGNFAELAKKNSDDPGSGQQGGELGWIQRGRTVPDFEKTAFSLQPGQTSGVIQSSYGFHIIQVEDKHTPHLKSLDEVKAQIEPVVAMQKGARQAESLANTVSKQAGSSGLQMAASKNGLEVMTASNVTRSDSVPGIGNAPEFMAAVFNAREKTPPQMVGFPSGYAIFQVQAVQPPATPSFEEIKSKVEQDYRRERSGQLLAQKIQQLSDRAHADHDLKKAAAEVGAVVKTSDLVLPTAQVPDIGSVAETPIPGLKQGEISTPFQTSQGGAVAKVIEQQQPNPAEFDAQREQLRATLLEQKRDEMLGLFADGLRARMEKAGKIKVNKKEMERLMPKQEAS